jgi:DNA-binding CsgD family transcriptional regulator
MCALALDYNSQGWARISLRLCGGGQKIRNERIMSSPTMRHTAVMKAAAQPERPEKLSVGAIDKSLPATKLTPPRSMAGFLLTDSLLNPLWFNAEAVQILSYPDKPADRAGLRAFLAEKIQSTLLTELPSSKTSIVTEFTSGRRRYFCRSFLLDSSPKEPSHPSYTILLERGPSGLVPPEVCRQFNLTQREREVLGYLVEGMSSNVIANRMNLSRNTVKAYLRMIMIKTRASSRSAILGKVVMTQAR